MIEKLIRNETGKRIVDWAKSENLIRQFSTDYTYNKYKAGEITYEEAYKKAYAKMWKTMCKERDKKLEELERIELYLEGYRMEGNINARQNV